MKIIDRRLSAVKNFFRFLIHYKSFYRRSFTSPSPNYFKMKTLIHFSDPRAAWLETGTYEGATTKFLAQRFPRVITLEPSSHYFQYSTAKLRGYKNVTILNGSSEDLFEESLMAISPLANLWLDGHYSDGLTFSGSNVSPIIHELLIIEKHKNKFESLNIFIDDVRLFPRSANNQGDGYPHIQSIFNWCYNNEFTWEIENDILIARKPL